MERNEKEKKVHICDPSREKGSHGNLRKVSTVVRLRNPRSLTTVETFRYWLIFCVLSDNILSY